MQHRFVIKQAGLIAVLLALTACGTPMPKYVPAANEPTAVIKLVGEQQGVNICRDGTLMHVSTIKTGETRTVIVPADKRITLWSYLMFQGYNTTVRCAAALSLVASSDAALILNTDIRANGCYVEAVREDASRPSGLAPEPSVGRPLC